MAAGNHQPANLPHKRTPGRSVSGDCGEFAVVGMLVQRHRPELYALALALTKDADDADDVVQGVILRALRHPERVEHGDRGVAYLRKGVRNEAMHVRDRHGTAEVLRQRLAVEPLRAPPRTPEHEMRRHVISEAIRGAIDALPPKRRDAYLHVRVYGRSYADAAEHTRCAVKTVENHVRLAEAALRQDPSLADIAGISR